MKRNHLLSSMLFLGITFLMPSQAMENGIESILENAILTSKKVEQIHQDGLERRQKEFEHLNKLITYIKEHPEKNEKLKETVSQKLNKDKLCFEDLTSVLKSFKPGDGKGTTHQLTSNKMHLGISGALKLLNDHFDGICEGNLPSGYSIEVPKANIFPNETHVYSTGRGISLKHLLVRTALSLLELDSDKHANLEVVAKDSPFIHFTPLPTGLDLTSYEGSPYFFGGDKPTLAVIHNGYAFGGQRFEEIVEPYGPDDCSTFVSKYYGLNYMTTTAEQYLAHQIGRKTFHFSSLGENVVNVWNEETEPKFSKDDTVLKILEQMEPLTVKTPDELQPGWVSAERRFANFVNNPSVVQVGAGGHTSIVLGTTGQDQEIKLWTLGANRDIEGQDMEFSYGIQSRSLFGDPLTASTSPLVMYFKAR